MTIYYYSLQVPLLIHQQNMMMKIMENMAIQNLGFAKWIGACPIPHETFLDAATERIYHNFLAKMMM